MAFLQSLSVCENGINMGSVPGVLNKILWEWDPGFWTILMIHSHLKTSAMWHSFLLRFIWGSRLSFGTGRCNLRWEEMCPSRGPKETFTCCWFGSFQLSCQSHLITSIQFSRYLLSLYTWHQNQGDRFSHEKLRSRDGKCLLQRQVVSGATGIWAHLIWSQRTCLKMALDHSSFPQDINFLNSSKKKSQWLQLIPGAGIYLFAYINWMNEMLCVKNGICYNACKQYWH